MSIAINILDHNTHTISFTVSCNRAPIVDNITSECPAVNGIYRMVPNYMNEELAYLRTLLMDKYIGSNDDNFAVYSNFKYLTPNGYSLSGVDRQWFHFRVVIVLGRAKQYSDEIIKDTKRFLRIIDAPFIMLHNPKHIANVLDVLTCEQTAQNVLQHVAIAIGFADSSLFAHNWKYYFPLYRQPVTAVVNKILRERQTLPEDNRYSDMNIRIFLPDVLEQNVPQTFTEVLHRYFKIDRNKSLIDPTEVLPQIGIKLDDRGEYESTPTSKEVPTEDTPVPMGHLKHPCLGDVMLLATPTGFDYKKLD